MEATRFMEMRKLGDSRDAAAIQSGGRSHWIVDDVVQTGTWAHRKKWGY